MGVIVCKFGGTSLADAQQIQKVCQIIRQDPRRRFVVCSAPGKRSGTDTKITDHLYNAYAMAGRGEDFSAPFSEIVNRFDGIIADLGLSLDLTPQYDEIARRLRSRADVTADYIASRGEYLNGFIMSALLERPMVDPADILRFDQNGSFDAEATQTLAAAALKDLPGAVVPGFYGAKADGTIVTFSRGGADVSGAIIARAVDAEAYENWTDVSGFLMTDPRIVENPHVIPFITYRELRELSYMGASVLHEEAIFPVRKASIPIHVRNTNDPEAPGTQIVPECAPQSRLITGIAGRCGYCVISLEKQLMNNELGFGRRVLQVLEDRGISFEHMPTGIDSLSLVVAGSQLEGKLEDVLSALGSACAPDRVEVDENIALIALVGQNMGRRVGVSARLFAALSNAGVNVRLIAQGQSEMNITVGVADPDFQAAIRAIYTAFEAE